MPVSVIVLTFNSAAAIGAPLARECLKMLRPGRGIEVTSIADIPSRGTGLGSSSSFTVGLLNSLYAFNAQRVSAEHLAQLAARVEIEMCHEPIGKQDHYEAAYGGLNFFVFEPDGSVQVSPAVCSNCTLEKLQERLGLYYTGITRSASEILKEQGMALESSASARGAMQQMVAFSRQMWHELEAGKVDS